MRWTIILPAALMVVLAGCDSGSSASTERPVFEWRQDAEKVVVAGGAIETHTATCPDAMGPVAGGFSIVSGAENFVPVTSKPDANRWLAAVRNTAAAGQPLELVVFVSCVAT